MKKGDNYAMDNSPARYLPGAVCATPATLVVLSREHLLQLLDGHLRGFWGETCNMTEEPMNAQFATEIGSCRGISSAVRPAF